MEIEDQLLSSYRYDLPVELIAQRPSDNSRLMVYDKKTNELFHSHFKNIADFLPDNCLLVFNRSKVFPSRLIGQKRSGGRVEILLLSLFKTNNSFEALIKTTSKKKIGDQFYFEDGLESEIVNIGSDGTFF